MKIKDLPVYKERNRIIEGLKKHSVIVVESPTGSGKTTGLPIILNEAGYAKSGMIGVTQPRRIATLSVCEYLAKQLKSPIPGYVGYKMRFEDKTLPETRLKIMTDGTLLQELKGDPFLSRYSVMIVDEAHERSLNIDFIIGLLKSILEKRSDFKVVISSATINPKTFSRYFFNAPIISIETPAYPVQVIYDVADNVLDAELLAEKVQGIVERVVVERRKGDILVFLPGEAAIKESMRALHSSSIHRKLKILPLYGRLAKEEQELAFLPPPAGKKKVILSTNIAETSVTFDGITIVIDSGQAKINLYSPRTFTSSLIEIKVPKSSLNQRRGRAGRTQPGVCYRLFSRDNLEEREEFLREEILRTDLTEVVIRMAELGIRDFENFNFLTTPGRSVIHSAVEILERLDALDKDRYLTKVGEMMIRYPLLPRISRCVVEAIMRYPDVIRETIIAAAFLSVHSPFLLPPGEEAEARNAHRSFGDSGGDFMVYQRLFHRFEHVKDKRRFCKRYYLEERTMVEIQNIVGQLEEITGNGLGVPVSSGGNTEDYLFACARGLQQFLCTKSGRGIYRSAAAERIIIHPGSVLFRDSPEYIVAGEIIKTSRMYARSVSPLSPKRLEREEPKLFEELSKSKGRPKEREEANSSIYLVGLTSFQIIKRRRRSIVLVDWERLGKEALSIGENLFKLPNIRGDLLFNGSVVMNSARMHTIFRAVLALNPAHDTRAKYPQGRHFNILHEEERDILLKNISCVSLLFTPKSKKKKGGNARITFIGLDTNGEGLFWFLDSPRYDSVLRQSIAAIEILLDQLKEVDTNGAAGRKAAEFLRKLEKIYLT